VPAGDETSTRSLPADLLLLVPDGLTYELSCGLPQAVSRDVDRKPR